MDSVFHLEDGDRAAFLDQIVQAFGCVYMCLKYYVPPPYNCLRGLDGIYHGRRNQESSSLSRRLFQVYRDSSSYPDTGLIPGLAFTTKNPYMKLNLHDLERLASSDFQLQFYQEAGIQTIVLMGCATGEIELGFSDDPQVDLEMEMKTLIRIRFPHHTAADPNQPPSSSSSSLRSLSVDSPDLLFNNPPPFPPQETLFENALPPLSPPPPPAATSAAASSPHEEAVQIVSHFRSPHVPSIESEDAAMTKAILAVLSSPSTSSSSPQENLRRKIPTAFRQYRPGSAPRLGFRKQSRFKRAVLFFRNLNMRTRPEFPVQVNRPTDTQLHHMISERRRRERLNESFHILRSFLPHGTKKDKASVLSSTTEYLSSLKSEVAELMKRNQILESQIMNSSTRKPESVGELGGASSSSSSLEERVSVEMAEVSSSSSSLEERLMEVRVRVRGEGRLVDLLSGVLGFLKGETSVSLTSVESNTRMVGSIAVHVLVMRLRIQGDEFDESGFREAVRSVANEDQNPNPNPNPNN